MNPFRISVNYNLDLRNIRNISAYLENVYRRLKEYEALMFYLLIMSYFLEEPLREKLRFFSNTCLCRCYLVKVEEKKVDVNKGFDSSGLFSTFCI